jgi:ATP-dependent RNA helicase RhlE
MLYCSGSREHDTMSFQDLRLSEPLVRAVADDGYVTPTPIQASAIPVVLSGQDVLGCAQTGTGKTCAFALPILHRLAEGKRPATEGKRGRGAPPRALVLCPTRELATQIYDSFVGYGRNVKLRYTVIYGGVSQGRQVRDLRGGVDVVVATPGRLLDLINQGHVDLSVIEVLVLDEADRMLDMGFITDIRKVVRMVPKHRQTLFFSATMSREIRSLADAILNDPVSIETERESSTVENIDQRVYMIDGKRKCGLLEHLLRTEDMKRTLVFTRTKHGADKLSRNLRKAGIGADAIHGNKSQNARFKALEGFKAGASTVLVATDIASRGIDVDEITHVVNYDMPIDPETYVHRIGRTARAGASGVAMSFCGKDERGKLKAIERQIKATLRRVDDVPHIPSAPKSTDGSGDQRDRSSGSKPRRSASAGDQPYAPRRPKGKAGKPGKKKPAHSTGDERYASSDVAKSKPKPKRKKTGSKGGWNSSSDRTSSGTAASGKDKKVNTKGKWKSGNDDRAVSTEGYKGKKKKATGKWESKSDDRAVSKDGAASKKKKSKKSTWKSPRAHEQGPAGSSNGKKKVKLGKAKWKAKAATAGRKGKVAKTGKKNTAATAGHRGSPGYKKKAPSKGKLKGSHAK